MLPSDHYVRMYNELFKMLEDQGHEHLQRYWLRISEQQDAILGPYIEAAGFQGMYEYWERIRVEENCEMDLEVTEDYFELIMHACPSLSKAMDNDAGVCPLYCDHCAGWVEPVMKKHGYYYVADMISRTEPRCAMRVYKDPQKAKAYAEAATLLAVPYPEAD